MLQVEVDTAVKPGLRDRKREATRTAIWQSAMRLFAARGYDEVTVEDIADVCELSPRTFFRYFATKEDVLFAGTELRRALFLDALADQPAGVGPFEAIEGASRVLAAHYEPDREALRTRARIVGAAPSLRSRNAGFPQQWDHDVAEQLRTSDRAAGMSDLELKLVTGLAMTALRVCIEHWIESDGDLLGFIESAFGRLGAGLARKSRPHHRRRVAG
jgi:AcrR family transcriptional regulator